MFCPQCREQISDISNFCRHCGVKIGHCPNCGNILEFDSKFCMHCGADMGKYILGGEIERPPVPEKIPEFEPEKMAEEEIKREPVMTVHPPAEETKERIFKFHVPSRSRIAEAVSGTKERLFKATPEERQVDDYIVRGVIDKLLNKKDYKSLDELKLDVVDKLKKNYSLSKGDMAFIGAEIKRRGYTGRFRIDDILAEKVGGRGRLMAIVISALMFISMAAFGGVIEEVVVGRLINEAPSIEIQEPLNNLEVSYGQAITFIGMSEDKEDKVLDGSSMYWRSNIDGDLGTGNSFSTDALSVGEHTITLTGEDSGGKDNSQSIVLKILARGLIYEMNLDKTVVVNGKEEKAYIKVWEPLINSEAPKKGWLEMENPFYKIKVNLDRSYYLLYDKLNQIDLFVFNDKVENPIDMLTGSDLGYADHSGNNVVQWSTTGRDDADGIGRHQILFEDKQNGFLIITTEGWDFITGDITRGYDVEAEVVFGLFADKPYFINADEFNNLQNLGIVQTKRQYRNPDEVIHSWVLTGKYDSAVIKGGDRNHLNLITWEPFYEVQTIAFKGRKVWHDGSATFSKMFPTHRLIGDKFGGAIIFSLPEGKFRFDDSLGVYGDQVTTEFIIGVDSPEKATAFTTEAVNEYAFFYDTETYQYYDSITGIATVTDTEGNSVLGEDVAFTLLDKSGTILNWASGVTDSSGMATVTFIIDNTISDKIENVSASVENTSLVVTASISPVPLEGKRTMLGICARYGLICPDKPLDARLWNTKRNAYVITLTKDWYNAATNQPNDETWSLADQGLEDFKRYESTILSQMEKTPPLAATKLGGTL
ncbi:MAG: zinc-ribbon domain-containing protein [Candidatus Hydrothermarchaeales archaeon]